MRTHTTTAKYQTTNKQQEQAANTQSTNDRANERSGQGLRARYFFVSWSPGPLFFCSFFLLFLLLFSSLSIKMISDDKNQQGIGVIQEQMKEASATKCRSNKWTNEQS